jgi:hypothetical protein
MDLRIINWAQYGVTVITPIGLIFALTMWGSILFLKREYKIVPFILIACFMTSMQRIVLFDLDFAYLRIAIFIGVALVLLSSNYKLKFNKIDKIMLLYMVSSIILGTFLSGQSGFIYKLGRTFFDSVLAYFLMRFIFQDIKDYNVVMKVLVVASVILAIFMINEKLTGRNWFSILGGVPEITVIRDGRLRAQATMSHPIIMGTFGASLLPFSWILWSQKKKFYAILGAMASITITFASASSGPVITLMCCIWGIFMWRFREKRKFFVPIIIISLIFLQLFMKAPIWFIFAHIDLAGGSDSIHRSLLIDQAIKHFTEWAMYGTLSAGHWAWGLQDITNQFLKEGFEGGLLTLILFAYIIKLCFNTVGNSLNFFIKSIENQKLAWALGTILFAHCVSFFGVSYFGHIEFFYYMLIAMISTLNDFHVDTGTVDTGMVDSNMMGTGIEDIKENII